MNGKQFIEKYLQGEKNFQGEIIESLSVTSEFINVSNILENLNLENANLLNWDIKNISFQTCNFNNSLISESYFEESSFADTTFIRTHFNRVSSVLLDFVRCDLNHSEFLECDFGDLHITASDLGESRWQEIFWDGSISDSRLNNSLISNLEISSLVVKNTFFPDGNLADLTIESLVIPSEVFLCSMVKSAVQKAIIEDSKIISTTGVDFSRLDNLLSSKNWVEADKETALLVCKLVGLETFGMIKIEQIEKIPCSDLHLIDKLWRDYSFNKFGFSVQSQIWKENSKKFREVNKSRRVYCAEIMGWDEVQSNDIIIYEPANNSPKLVIEGYLPAIGIWDSLYDLFFFGEKDFECIYNCFLECDS